MDIEQTLFEILPDKRQPVPTELRNPNTMNLASSNVNQILNLFLDDTLQAVHCLNSYVDEIEKLIEDVIVCLKNGGMKEVMMMM